MSSLRLALLMSVGNNVLGCFGGPAEGEEDNCSCLKGCSNGYGNCANSWYCYEGYSCGVDNCVNYHEDALPESDCCYPRPKCDGSVGLEHCCLAWPTEVCYEGEGDCDYDDECADGLLCGNNNCQKYNPTADPEADCCYYPGNEGEFKSTLIVFYIFS